MVSSERKTGRNSEAEPITGGGWCGSLVGGGGDGVHDRKKTTYHSESMRLHTDLSGYTNRNIERWSSSCSTKDGNDKLVYP